MTKAAEIYKCSVCGNVVSVIEVGGGTLVCCGVDMRLLEVKTEVQEGKEKHVPVMTIDNNRVTVNIGSVDHPMEEKHYIELIQIVKGNKVLAQKHLYPGMKPTAVFLIDDTEGISARELCNVHGLWTN